jgi:hypothetical protein
MFRLGALDEEGGVAGWRDAQRLLVHQAGHGKEPVGKLTHIEGGEQLGLAPAPILQAALGRLKLLDQVT